MTLLSIEALEVRYGAVPALRGVSVTVGAGEAVALLGANGAGKSTLMKAVIGLVRPAAGRILFDGRPLEGLRADRRARMGVGYCPEGRRVFAGMTVRENLLVACWGGGRQRAQRIDAMFAMFPALAARQGVLAWQLSGGQQQMLAIGRSLMDAPRLLLLDEPSLGLSPLLTDEVLGRIPAIVAGGTAVLLAEQNAAKALGVCSRGVVLKLGQVAAEGRAADLAASDEVRAAFLGG
ncbi:ABC transporter ATP-binding protein [Acidisphaera sp. S103]|uniref:ABC transporter ATP-binding protein n=1 Tax=Acidisphaera sp. S103 TaxID=1747223 RepID=UPI00131DA098|nr:ABC transporter ATP-binding protein [Acidisphaera sp. S103]